MLATREELEYWQIPLHLRDYCAHIQIKLTECRRINYSSPHSYALFSSSLFLPCIPSLFPPFFGLILNVGATTNSMMLRDANGNSKFSSLAHISLYILSSITSILLFSSIFLLFSLFFFFSIFLTHLQVQKKNEAEGIVATSQKECRGKKEVV